MPSKDIGEAFEKLEHPSNDQGPNSESSWSEDNTQPAELVYKLSRVERYLIKRNLNGYTRLFSGEKLQTETKEQLTDANVNLYRSLIGLSRKSNAIAHGVVLNLDSSLRLQIIRALIGNHSLVVDPELASKKSKKKMVEQNNDLIVKLNKLQLDVIAGIPDFPGCTDGFVLNGKLA